MTIQTAKSSVVKRNHVFGIRFRTTLSQLLLIAFVLVIGIYSISNINALATKLLNINEVNSVKQRFAINFRGSVHDRAIEVRDVVLATNPNARAHALRQITALEDAYTASAGPLDAMFVDDLPDSDTERDILSRIKAVEAKTIPIYESVFQAVDEDRMSEATTILMEDSRPAFIDWLAVINEFIDYQEAKNQRIGALVNTQVASFSTGLPIVLGIAVILGLAFMIWMSRTLKPLKSVTQTIETIATGNLNASTEKGAAVEIGELQAAAASLVETLQLSERERKEQAKAKELARQEAAEKEKAMIEEREEAAKRQAQADQAAKEVAEARQSQYAELANELSQVIENAQAGDFAVRVNAKFSEPSMNDLVSSVNTLMQSVDENLSYTGAVLARVAAGDLTQLMQGDFKGAFRDLQNNTNDMISALSSLVGEISGSAGTLASSSGELRDTSDTLSKQAEQNAASLEETSGALEELTTSIKQVSDNVREADKNANSASETAQSSSVVAADAAEAMTKISDASKEIAKVVKVINDIAFQINLLALNAGVEAARAGEAGRGFSVVAAEVRQLSQRASEAAKEIDDVIVRSDTAVSEGVSKVTNAQQSLEKISESVIDVSKSINQISTAISEQVNGITEINTAVSQIDGNTQKQAASFEEVTAAGGVLSNEAENLRQTTLRFKIGHEPTSLRSERTATVVAPAKKAPSVPGVEGNLARDTSGWEEF